MENYVSEKQTPEDIRHLGKFNQIDLEFLRELLHKINTATKPWDTRSNVFESQDIFWSNTSMKWEKAKG